MWLAPKTISEKYQSVVSNALSDENTFQVFKSLKEYNDVVGMCRDWQADVWIKNISENHPEVFEDLFIYAENDLYGNSTHYMDVKNRKLSAGTLRYLNTVIEIDNFFNLKNNPINVVELGVGYGGLCFVMNKYFQINSYSLLDLPNVQLFADKYLRKLNITTQTTVVPEQIDLFVSEFCLSEFDDTDIYDFYNRYIAKAKRVYLVMNMNELERKDKFFKTISMDFDIVITDEYPKTHWPNYVIKGVSK